MSIESHWAVVKVTLWLREGLTWHRLVLLLLGVGGGDSII